MKNPTGQGGERNHSDATSKGRVGRAWGRRAAANLPTLPTKFLGGRKHPLPSYPHSFLSVFLKGWKVGRLEDRLRQKGSRLPTLFGKVGIPACFSLVSLRGMKKGWQLANPSAAGWQAAQGLMNTQRCELATVRLTLLNPSSRMIAATCI